MALVVSFIRLIFQLLTLIIFVDVIISFFMPPYHKVRQVLDKIVDPMLQPIRRIIPAIGNIDFSPIVLLLVLQLMEYLILRILL